MSAIEMSIGVLIEYGETFFKVVSMAAELVRIEQQ